jgi:hypothetical protein
MTLRIGDTGPEVLAWQRALIARGQKLAVDGIFGRQTHNATLAFQSAHGLLLLETSEPGVVGPNELQVLASPSSASIRPPPMLPHTIPFVEARHYGHTPRALIDLIVLHCMEAPEASTTAERCAVYFATTDTHASAHYCVDADSVVQCVPDHCVAYAAPGANHNGLQIELAGYARQSRAEWLDAFGARMLWLAAQLVARKHRERPNIPIRYLSAKELRAKRPTGITTHHEVSLAYKRSNHHDPGPGFPMDYFLEQVELATESTHQERVS